MGGLIVWYKVQIEEADAAAGGLLSDVAAMFTGGLPIKVSNDVFSGQYILDAEIELTMKEGASASQFLVKLPNLPAAVVDTLKSKHSEAVKGGKPLQAKIYLGYFEKGPTFTSPDPVMEGSITRIKVTVDEGGLLVTEIEGQENTGYKLRQYCSPGHWPGPVNADTIVKEIAKAVGIKLAKEASLEVEDWPKFTLRKVSGLDALNTITQRAKKPIVIRDGQIYLNKSVGLEQGPTFDPDVNLVQKDDEYNAEIREKCPVDKNGKATNGQTRSSINALLLGEPSLRVGQKITLKTEDAPSGTLRTNEVKHIFSPARGYICQVKLVVAEPGELADNHGGPQIVVDRISDLSKTARNQHPAIDVGEVKEYSAGSQSKHLTTLFYGQSPPEDAVSPSVEIEVDQDTQLRDMPFLSPFAWHQCGLIVPVYPKMRALLAHNRSLVNDAVVAGFLWSENPNYARPKNDPGDYWLSLPTELDSNGLPTGKGVNDLTDSRGLRVIQAKGLHILVGTSALLDVGARPGVPDEDTIVIEHSSGTKITISSSGALQIETSNQEIALTNGAVTMKLNGPAVEVS